MSKRLGFDVDVTLRLAACSPQSLTGTLELSDASWLDSLQNTIPGSARFTIFTKDGMTILQENFHYEPADISA
jgi:hypothetical protein